MSKEILVLYIYKKSKHDDSTARDTQVGLTAEGLIDYLCSHYKLDKALFIKDERDNFPYFTDGGFRYSYDHRDWNYTFVCIPQTLH